MCELQSNCRFSRDELSKVKCTTAQKRVQISHEESKKKTKKRERKKKKPGKLWAAFEWCAIEMNATYQKLYPLQWTAIAPSPQSALVQEFLQNTKKKNLNSKKNSNKMHLVYWDASMKWMWSEWERVRRLIKKVQIFDVSQSRAETTEFKFYVHSNSKHSNTGTCTPNQFESMKHSKKRNKKYKHVHKKKKKKKHQKETI